MSRPITQLHPPRDYPEQDDHDPTGYYARKTAHREEMLPYLAAIFIAGLACVVVAWAWSFFT
jgi:hypothetical protein